MPVFGASKPHPLFREPTVWVEQFDADALATVLRICPDAVDFGGKRAPERGGQLDDSAELQLRVADKCCAAATDAHGFGADAERLAVARLSLQFDCEVDGHARAARALLGAARR